ncbi:putative benzoate 4-monooxygenase cytochrome P450 [Acephala macrosclerotiorum]|nr:putative benzoate 4-monooxygenase cytochrome P450 [Acephala macrosclerotiorum]
MPTLIKLLVFAILALQYFAFKNLLRIKGVPGPKLYALTKWRLAYDDWRGTRTRTINQLHQEFGPVVRIGPNEMSFNSLSALKTIYGAGSGFERTTYYRMFDVYGRPNLFSFTSVKAHGERKKLLNHAYSKSSILKVTAPAVEQKAWEYMKLLETSPETASEIFHSLHYYSLDNITHFLYGENFGATSALAGSASDRAIMDDVLDPARRKMSWFLVHLPRYTKWLITRTGLAETMVAGLLPQKKPTAMTGLRTHALKSWETFYASSSNMKARSKSTTIIGKLWDHHISKKQGGLLNLEIASEVADHFLAGIDTTSDTLMFLIWALSLPENLHSQQKLIDEVLAMPKSDLDARGIPTADATGKLPYLDAVIKETLRLYAPLPASEPRLLPTDTTIDGFQVPANTTVGMSPYSLHRNPEVYRDPLVFNPDRWLGDAKDVAEMKKWFWAFSSGGRMCIGLHLAMAEMTTLTAAIYREYRTKVKAGTEDITPGITSRFEVFYDESKPHMREHECWIDFEKQVR